MRVRNVARGTVVATRLAVAERWWQRLRGLLGRRALDDGEALLLAPCRGVHMLGMRFAIDVAFVTRDGKVVAVYPALAPGTRTRMHRDAWGALELAAGALATSGTVIGDRLSWEETDS
jgi:uncharacterized membrane protein (UPF0127 family)